LLIEKLRKIQKTSKMKNQNILFLGCGKMGSILVNNLLEESGFETSQIKILKKSDKNKISHLNYVKNTESFPKNYQADLVFIAIKPQESEKILKDFAKKALEQKILHKDTIFISILAGKKLEFFTNFFGKSAKIVRSMPNLPIQYSQGIFPYLCNKNIKKSESNKLDKIFEKFGLAFELENEELFNAITAIFGSGPAYIFLLQEIFEEIAKSLGIKKSSKLVKKLFLGSALMSEFSDKNFNQLRESVTSKGGTTESAIKILEKNSALKKLFKQAIDAANAKSKNL
jgi:pyrroline-5-carboxylate reductase